MSTKSLYIDTLNSPLFSSGPIVIFIWKNTHNWPVEAVSSNLKALYGYETEQYTSNSIAYINQIHPDDLTRVIDEVTIASQNKLTNFSHKPYRYKDAYGKYHWVSDLTTILYDKKGNITEYVGYLTDITQSIENQNRLIEQERKFKESLEVQKKELENEKELYHLIFKNNADSVLLIDVQTQTFIDCNTAAIKTLGYDSKDSILNLHPAELSPKFQPDGKLSREKVLKNEEMVAKHGSHTFEWKHLKKDGTEVWIEVSLKSIALKGRKVIYTVWKNIEEEKRIAHELEEQRTLLIQQAKLHSMGEMIGNIAHQWRQPLNALGLIMQKLQLFESHGVLDANKLNSSINKSMSLINNMSTTIDDFRGFFNPKKVQEDFFLTDSISDAYNILDATLKNNAITFKLNIKDADLSIYGYKNEFSQVILNLLNNAKDALIEKQIEHAYIHVDIKKKNNHIEIEVADNGGGISNNIEDDIFNPYFTSKEEGKGDGIGLYMSRMIIEEHMNGKLSYKNTSDGVCFKIII